jgi:HK97 family phage major capsid protein
MNATQLQELRLLQREATALRSKPNLTKDDAIRAQLLMSEIALVRQGASLLDIKQMDLNEFEDRHGFERTVLNPTKFSSLKPEQRAEWKIWRDAIIDGKIEKRDQGVGNPINAIGSFSGLGYFIPATYLGDIFNTIRWYDALLDPDVTTYIETTKASPMQIATYDDSGVFGAEAPEGSDQSANGVDLQNSGEITLGAWSYRTPMWRVSREALQDAEIGYGLIQMFKTFAAQRIARIVGKRLLLGTGINQPTGLIPALAARGVVPVIATGSSLNTGGSETGRTSIGTFDIGQLYSAVDPAYRVSPKCAFLMNDNTFAYLQSLTSKQGVQVVEFREGAAKILNKPVYICPSMDSLGPAGNPVLFGDLSYYAVRCAKDPLTYVQVFQQAPGLVEKGEIGLRMFVRYDGNLLYNGGATKPPIAILQCHS